MLLVLWLLVGMILFLNVVDCVVVQVWVCDCVVKVFCILWLILCICVSIFVVKFIMFVVLVILWFRLGWKLMLWFIGIWFICFMLLIRYVCVLLVMIICVVLCSVCMDELYKWLMVIVGIECGIFVSSVVLWVILKFCFSVCCI